MLGLLCIVKPSNFIENGRASKQIVYVAMKNGKQAAVFDFRLELVSSEKTDQQLADEYRQIRKNLKEVGEELTRRGFAVSSQGETTTIFKLKRVEL